MQLEGFSVERADILDQQHALQVVFQGSQLEVCLSVVVWQDGDAVVQLRGVGICCIVH